ncbi:hypothetical protein SAMN05444920_13210 [Nonomuraea solani]|uniref:Uncharacterized protein n=1 Tax=Nonomuraea solani TaxID=1144553 RepID=A0A1H6F0W0_9ACTN|nr:hypothetical protein [Nonomuraea solani]SEH03001.1 hypothetical protein SAMN05444920_13210 [Nonomuraea solani]
MLTHTTASVFVSGRNDLRIAQLYPKRPVVPLDASGLGRQRLPYDASGFLDRWLDGRLDLPVLSLSAVPRTRVLFPRASSPVLCRGGAARHAGAIGDDHRRAAEQRPHL